VRQPGGAALPGPRELRADARAAARRATRERDRRRRSGRRAADAMMLTRARAPSPEAQLELFELEMLGGGTERRYRRARPEVEALPWGTIEPARHRGADLIDARMHWTIAAFQEQRTGAACAETVRALLAARAPLDLVAAASRFPLDEIVHVEMCARV